MIKISVYQNEKHEYTGFLVEDHAGYAEEGSDIICAAVSMLTMNTINAIERFTDDSFHVDTDEQNVRISFVLDEEPSKETVLLIDTLILGIQSLEDDEIYTKYIDLIFEEV